MLTTQQGRRRPILATRHQSSQPNVLHVITRLWTGGANMMLVKLVEECAKQGMAHSVVCLMRGGALRGRLVDAGIDLGEIGLRSGQLSVRAAIKLASICRARAPDVIQGWAYHGNLAATWGTWASGRRSPVIWGIRHSIQDLTNDKPLTRALIRLGAPLSRTTAAVVYCSRASARQHERIGYDATKTVVIPNGFDCDAFRPMPEAKSRLQNELDFPPGRVVIGHVARFHPMKDHGNLIAAVARLIAEDQDVHLVMIGRDVEWRNCELAALIRGAGIGARVSMLGERTDIAQIIPGFDVLALSSSTGEAFPNVLGEAMASGVPCVATDLGDCAWIIGDTGVIVPAQSPELLAAGLRQLVDLGPAERARCGRIARLRIVAHFELSAVAHQYALLYQRVRLPRRCNLN